MSDKKLLQVEGSFHNYPDAKGHFGPFGGRFVGETYIRAIDELTDAYQKYVVDPDFIQELDYELTHYVGRPSPLYFAEQLTKHFNGPKIYLKREDLNHTGAHKVNNTIGQALLAKRMGKKRVIAETGAGQHGVATASVAARLGLECVVYMGEEDMQRQALNVYRMKLMGATVVPVTSGTKTLKDALNEAMRDWVANIDDTFYIIGTVAGPHPYPAMVRDFQAIIGREAKQQALQQIGRLPDALVACVGGGSNAIGLFYEFLDDRSVQIYGVEPAGYGMETGQHAAPLCDENAAIGVLHGNRTYVMSDEYGQVLSTHSVSAGLDYPAVGPEHAWLRDTGRANYVNVTDEQALEAFRLLNKCEGILPALESSHAIAYLSELTQHMTAEQSVIVSLSGRGDKDIPTVAKIDGIQF